MELRTEKMSLRGRLLSAAMKTLTKTLTKHGKTICDPEIIKSQMGKWNIPKGYTCAKYNLGTCKIEVIKKGSGNKDGNVIYYLHGGGYTMPLTNIYRRAAVKLSKMTNDSDVVLLDYRIAPKHVYPAALEDALQGWFKLHDMGYLPSRTVLFGESAGGNLCIALTAKLRDMGAKLPCSLAVMSAWTDFAATGESYIRNLKTDPLFGLNKYMTEPDHRIAETYAGDTPLDHPGLSPLYGSFENFPPMFMQAATSEMLYSDTESVVRKAKKAGVRIKAQAYDGLFHCFQVIGMNLPESRIAWNDTAEFINSQLS